MEVFRFLNSVRAVTGVAIFVFVSAQAGNAQTNSVTNSVPSAATASLPGSTNNPALRNYQLDDQHTLRAGDKISFRIVEDNEDAKSLTVTDSGELDVPYIGRIPVAGKTCRAVARDAKALLERDYYKRATVQLGLDAMNNVRGKAYVSGQVSKPGPVPIPVNAPLKLSQAIILAGPPTQWAKLSAVRVVRQTAKEPTIFIVDVDSILNKGRIEKDINLEPDDLVIVTERGVNFGG